jgi:hypothetical protein
MSLFFLRESSQTSKLKTENLRGDLSPRPATARRIHHHTVAGTLATFKFFTLDRMNSSASVPLMDALPWSLSDGNSCWLVCDSVETDGRFLLHSLVTRTLKQQQEKVYWLACGPWTCQLIAAALKKMGCDAAALYLRDSASSPLNVQSVTVDMSTKLEENDEFDAKMYIKELYRSISKWIHQNASRNALIVMDDVSALAALVGERLTFCLLQSVRALQTSNSFNFVMKCSQDYDMDLIQQEDTSRVCPGGSLNVDWVGAGGGTSHAILHVPWERSLVELADTIVNVEPLASGYSREAHGRLVVVDSSSLTPIILNYCCQDSSVSAVRLRGPVSSK